MRFIYCVNANSKSNKATAVVSHNEYYHLIEFFVTADAKDDFKLKPQFRTEMISDVGTAAAKSERIAGVKRPSEFHAAGSASELCSILKRELPAPLRGLVSKAVADVISSELDDEGMPVEVEKQTVEVEMNNLKNVEATKDINQSWGFF